MFGVLVVDVIEEKQHTTERVGLYNQIGLVDARLYRQPKPTDEVYRQELRLDYAAIQ